MSEPLVDRAPTTKIISFQEAAAAKEANRIAVKPWLAVAACAAVVTGGVTWNQARLAKENTIAASQPTITPQVPQYVQKSSQSQFQGVHQAGLVFDPTHGPMRKVRFQFDNHEQFVDPSNGARIEIRYPSQQEILIVEPVQ